MAVHEHALAPVTIHDVGDDGYCDYCRPDAAPPKEVDDGWQTHDEAEGIPEMEPVAWRYRTIGRSGKRYNWLYLDEIPKDDGWLPENPDHYELQPLYAALADSADAPENDQVVRARQQAIGLDNWADVLEAHEPGSSAKGILMLRAAAKTLRGLASADAPEGPCACETSQKLRFWHCDCGRRWPAEGTQTNRLDAQQEGT